MAIEAKFINASDFTKRNRDYVFNNLINNRVELWYKIENAVGERNIYIKAMSSNKEIGFVDFEEDVNTIDLQNINIKDEFKRCGLGKAMCILAVGILEKPARNIWEDSETTEEFLAFWKHLKCQYSNQFV